MKDLNEIVKGLQEALDSKKAEDIKAVGRSQSGGFMQVPAFPMEEENPGREWT